MAGLWTLPMRARSADESHRTATPLELLFDLTFVVAAAVVATELAHAIAEDHVVDGVTGFVTVFFAIWWAWMNFTWFASSFDTDDALYRVLTLVQMAGVLVLASGVPGAFDDQNFVAVTVGYVIMRVAMISQWLRSSGDPGFRAPALRYAGGISAVQVFWLLRLLLPDSLGIVSFLVLAAAEMAVPLWAERPGMTTWHPHHIAERYGLFAIIMLGECIRAASVAADSGADEAGWTLDLVLVFGASLVITFALWWIYFLKPAGEGLANNRDRSFVWGYGHYFLFAALVALGGVLEVAVEAVTHHVEASDTLISVSVAFPVAAFLFLAWALHHPLGVGFPGDREQAVVAAVATLVLGFAPSVGVSLSLALVLIALPAVAMIVLATATGKIPTAGSDPAGSAGTGSSAVAGG